FRVCEGAHFFTGGDVYFSSPLAWIKLNKRIAKADRRCFDSLVVLTCWILWKERNRRTFDHHACTIADLQTLISDVVVSWCQAG
ncbi:hypothetical protein PVAP13_1NG426757, partial [Panicum virgatum]